VAGSEPVPRLDQEKAIQRIITLLDNLYAVMAFSGRDKNKLRKRVNVPASLTLPMRQEQGML
jgi:hypothetical protein